MVGSRRADGGLVRRRRRYRLCLIGFLLFYGLDHLRKRLHRHSTNERVGKAFKISITGFAAYIALMAYLLVHNLEDTPRSVALFAVAIAVHFIGVDRALHEEYGTVYERLGRYVLAAMPPLGWGTGMLVTLPRSVLASIVAFISGAVIMNSSITELPSESKGRFLPFMCGGLVYGLILLPFG
jgi:zinc transporter ZupT